jgi:hypothetical protein
MMFLGAGLFPGRLYIAFALVVSVWMVAMGVLMWRRAEAAHNGEPPPEREEQSTDTFNEEALS